MAESLPLKSLVGSLFKLEGSAAYRDAVDLDVHAIPKRSENEGYCPLFSSSLPTPK
jgi:hypothetical protein